jgi:hypothetical protein
MEAKIKTRPSTGPTWPGWVAEFVGLPAGSTENALVGKGSTEEIAVMDLIGQAGYNTVRKVPAGWIARKK